MAGQLQQTRVVWIASAPHTGFRVKDACLDTGAVFKTRKCNLNTAAQTVPILEACEQAGVDNLNEEAVDSILAVALVEPLFVLDPLRSLTKMEKLQKEFFERFYAEANDLHGVLTFFKVCDCAK